MHFTRPFHSSRSGFSLIEAAIVLGVVGLVIGGIWAAASSISRNMRKNEALSGIMQIMNRIKNLPPDGSQYIATAIDCPKGWPYASGTCGFPSNGNARLLARRGSAAQVAGYAGYFFTLDLYFNPYDPQFCGDLVNYYSGMYEKTGLDRIEVQTSSDTLIFTAATEDLAMGPGYAAQICADAGQVTFYYTR